MATVGYDGGHRTRTTKDLDERGKVQATMTSHRSGREDVTVHAPTVQLKTRVNEDR